MSYYQVNYINDPNQELMHFGVKGQRWGVRRYQNEDGSLTEEGMRRYGESAYTSSGRAQSDMNRIGNESLKAMKKSDKYNDKAVRTENKIKIMQMKGKNVDKLIEKSKQYKTKSEKFANLSTRGAQFVAKIGEQQTNMGRSIDSTYDLGRGKIENGQRVYSAEKVKHKVKNDYRGETTTRVRFRL